MIELMLDAAVHAPSAKRAASSIYPAVQNLLLAAGGLGYASCLTTGLTTLFAEQVRDLLGLPEHLQAHAAVYVGHPTRELGRPRRNPATLPAHRERYGEAW